MAKSSACVCSRALVCECTRAALSLCTRTSAGGQHLECVPSSLCSCSCGWQDGEQQPSSGSVRRVLLCWAPLGSVEPQIHTASTVRLKREGAKEELHARQNREKTDGFLCPDPIGRNTPSQFNNSGFSPSKLRSSDFWTFLTSLLWLFSSPWRSKVLPVNLDRLQTDNWSYYSTGKKIETDLRTDKERKAREKKRAGENEILRGGSETGGGGWAEEQTGRGRGGKRVDGKREREAERMRVVSGETKQKWWEREKQVEEGWEQGRGKQQVGQPMQILPEQRANQRGRQPLQRSGLPLVTGRRNPREGREKDAEVDRKDVQ